jgi:hypothetical protein
MATVKARNIVPCNKNHTWPLYPWHSPNTKLGWNRIWMQLGKLSSKVMFWKVEGWTVEKLPSECIEQEPEFLNSHHLHRCYNKDALVWCSYSTLHSARYPQHIAHSEKSLARLFCHCWGTCCYINLPLEFKNYYKITKLLDADSSTQGLL